MMVMFFGAYMSQQANNRLKHNQLQNLNDSTWNSNINVFQQIAIFLLQLCGIIVVTAHKIL